MKKQFRPLIAFLILAVVMMACAIPSLGSNEPTADQVSTVVALTMQALTPASDGAATPTSQPSPAGLLPQSLYFLNNDNIGVLQVFRLGTDGKSVSQVTSEPVAVGAFDVSPVDGSVVYVVNNQLVLINADGSGRRVLADGGPADPVDPFISSLSSPIFSPDGQTIAYSQRGLILYSLATGASNMVLEEMTTDPSTGAAVPAKVFFPQSYSPDGTKILVTGAIPRSDGFIQQIYTIASDSTVELSGGDGARLCCDQQAWTADSSTLYAGNSSFGLFLPGLWRINAATGAVTTLIPGEAGGTLYNTPDEPYLAPDGQLYFFYAQVTAPDGFSSRAPLQMVRSAPDGVAGRITLRDETFELMNEALWSPDASFVLVVMAPNQDVYQGGKLDLYYTDPGRPVVNLLPFAQHLKWGP